MLQAKAKIKKNVLTREECKKIIEDSVNFKYDILKQDVAPQSEMFDKETLDSNTVEKSLDETFEKRIVSQSPMEPVFSEWDGNPVYRCKVMKYEEGEFVAEHHDAEWICLSNYWAPGTDKVSQSLVVIPLNDDYEGGEFTVEGTEIPQTVGTAIQVPCNAFDKDFNLKHGVKKVTAGTRYALVFWNFA